MIYYKYKTIKILKKNHFNYKNNSKIIINLKQKLKKKIILLNKK